MATCGNRLLIAEDEPLLRVSMADALRKEGWTVDVAADGVKAVALFEQYLHDVVVTDLVMPSLDGMGLLKRVKALQPDTTVVLITAHGSVSKAVEAMRQGASDFVTKPFSMAQLLVRLESVCSHRQLQQQNVRLQEELEGRHSFSNIIGRSKKMQDVFWLIREVAGSDANVLIQGESGTGKELVASAIHYNSKRRARPYVRVSCASLPESLVESELFGYEKGAFTGATQRRIGRFEAAGGGTLFLDEIGDLPLAVQSKLLRVLQERQIERLGSNRSIDVDVRFVSATLRSLEEEMVEGSFREDLFFRINTVPIALPPLRDRREDIPLLAQAFLREFSGERGKAIENLDDDTLEILDDHTWPGNVRELRNVLERAVVFCRGSRITPEHLPPGLRDVPGLASVSAAPPPRQAEPLRKAVERAEIEAIRAALNATDGRRNDAAEILGISRKTLWEKIKGYALDAPASPKKT
jgi:DNA-binding NtrC family response regulator